MGLMLASVLVFDEATSLLDDATEQSMMDTIEDLNHDLTLLIIAYPLTAMFRPHRTGVEF